MSDLPTGDASLAWMAALAAALLSWFARGLGVGKEWGTVKSELSVIRSQLSAIQTWQIEHTKMDSEASGRISQNLRDLGERLANLHGRFAEYREKND